MSDAAHDISQEYNILIIDDNATIHEDFKSILEVKPDNSLENDEKYLFGETHTTHDSSVTYILDYAFQGQEGIELLRNAKNNNRYYTVAFVDMRMPPGWDGLETILRLWELDPDIQVVICTAYSDYTFSEITEKLKYSGNYLILKKPFDKIEVLQLTRSLSEKWQLFSSLKKRALELEHANHELKNIKSELEDRIDLRTHELLNTNQSLETEITERKAAEKKLGALLKQVNRKVTELEKTKTELNQAKEDAESANLTKSEFLANMSHEIRTPMNGVIAAADLALDENTSPRVGKFLNIIRTSGQMLMSIINDVLDFSKIEADQISLEIRPFKLQSFIKDLVSPFQKECLEKKIHLTSILDPGVHDTYSGDIFRINQIMTNLLGNAVKFTPENGHIIVGITTDPEKFRDPYQFLEFYVKDTGIGISENEKETLFKPFIQADSSITRKYGGTGLGLSICKHLATMMKGSMHIESKLNHGSRFSFSLHLEHIPNQANPELFDTDKQETINHYHSALHGIHILIVEDNKTNQEIAQAILKNNNIQSTIATNGEEALHILKKKTFDLILMDIQMPVLDGFKTTSMIRKNNQLSHVPVIAMTAHALKGDKEKCIQSGMNGYLTKPVKQDSMMQAITSALNDHTKHQAPVLPPDLTATSDSIPVLDTKKALKDLGLTPEIYHRILENFIANNQEMNAKISSAVHQKQLDILTEIFHTLKGSSGNIGGYRTEEYAKNLEQLLRGKKSSADLTENNLAEIVLFKNTFDELLKTIRNYIKDAKES